MARAGPPPPSLLVLLLLLAAVAVVDAGSGTTLGAWRRIAGTGKSGYGGDTFHSSIHDFAVETRLNSPWGLALDTDFERLYVSDTMNHVIRSIDLISGLMEVIAGSERSGDMGDDQAAVQAELNAPMGLALDMVGRVLYVADTANHRVRAIALDPGRVYQAEENGSLPIGDGSVAATVELEGAEGRYRCPDLNGPGANANVTPLLLGSKFCAGATGSGFVTYLDLIAEHIDFHVHATSGPGVYELRFRYSDRYDHVHATGDRRLRVLVNGAVQTDSQLFPPTGNNQAGRRDVYEWSTLSASLDFGLNVVRLQLNGFGGPQVDQLYVVPPRTNIYTVAGTGTAGPVSCRHGCYSDYPTNRVATSSALNSPVGLSSDSVSRLLYIADSGNGRVLQLDVMAGTISTIVGGATRSSTRDGEVGGALYGKLFKPTGLQLDSSRTFLYIVDSVENRVRRVDLSDPVETRRITTLAGVGKKVAPFQHVLSSPQAVALDETTGTLYISDMENARVRHVNLAGGTCDLEVVKRLPCAYENVDETQCKTVVGCCWDPDCLDGFNPDGRSPSAQPEDVLTKADQKASDPPISFIRRGSGFCCHPNLRAMRSLEALDSPAGLVWDSRDGSLYVAQQRSHRILRLTMTDSQCAASANQC